MVVLLHVKYIHKWGHFPISCFLFLVILHCYVMVLKHLTTHTGTLTCNTYMFLHSPPLLQNALNIGFIHTHLNISFFIIFFFYSSSHLSYRFCCCCSRSRVLSVLVTLYTIYNITQYNTTQHKYYCLWLKY